MKKIAIIGDLHVPYHNKRAVALARRVLDAWEPDILVSLGDFFDFYAVSRHSKDPKRESRLVKELALGAELLESFSAICKEKYFLEGNHEDRLARYIADIAPALDELVSIDSCLNVTKLGWKHHPYGKFIKIGKVVYTHDLDYDGDYAAKRSVEEAGHSIVIGHVHRISLHVVSDIHGIPAVGATFGWLGDIDTIDYMHRLKANRRWALGFGIGYIDEKDGVTQLTPVPIVRNSCIVEGERFDG